MKKCKIGWHIINPNANIPTKSKEAAGFDIYTTEHNIRLEPHTQHLFATGIGCTLNKGYWLMVFDRGSTGSKGLHVHCGVIDNDYRGEIFICIKNDNDYPVVIGSDIDQKINDVLHYPFSKAIAQIIPVGQPQCITNIVDNDQWSKSIEKSKRKDGKLGSSGK